MSINVKEQSLPGIGQRFEIELSPGRNLVVVATRDGGRAIGVSGPDTDEVATLALTADQSVMLGALLLGARFAIDTSDDPRVEGDTVVVETVTIPPDAVAIGHRPSQLLAPIAADAALLGVIRDTTPEIVEDQDAPLAPGDRVAIAVRRDRLETVGRAFTG